MRRNTTWIVSIDSNIITVGMGIDNSIGKLTPDRNLKDKDEKKR